MNSHHHFLLPSVIAPGSPRSRYWCFSQEAHKSGLFKEAAASLPDMSPSGQH